MNAQVFKASSFLIALVAMSGCSNRADKLPHYSLVPDFSMTDTDGRAFHSSQLKGKVWVADFIYTNCPAACPLMSSKMKRFSGQVHSDVRLVSISVDPEHDTPAALKTFAARYGAPTLQWTFITGSAETVHLLAWSTFHLGDVISKMEHSTKFALVDQRGVVRGYYSSFDADGMASLLRDANALSDDKS